MTLVTVVCVDDWDGGRSRFHPLSCRRAAIYGAAGLTSILRPVALDVAVSIPLGKQARPTLRSLRLIPNLCHYFCHYFS